MLLSPERIVMMEDHDKAYNAWKDRAVRGRTLVHVDAHIDFGWIPEMDLDEIGIDGTAPGERALLNPFISTRKKMVNIGNYICPAMRDGIVEKFYWIVPGQSWHDPRGRRHIIKQLKRLLAIKKDGPAPIEIGKDRIACRLMGKEVIMTTLEGLERIEEPVLLDIDVDFMLTPRIWDDLNPERMPWIFPDELFRKVTLKIKGIDLLTIAYSVEGGFTPLKFKYLGDELHALYTGELTERKRAVIQAKREAIAHAKDGREDDAIVSYREALRFDENDASAYFNLCLLHMDGSAGGREEAARCYAEALKRDKTYATVFNNYGILYLLRNKPDKAEREYKKFLCIDGNNVASLCGAAHAVLAKRRYAEARNFFDRCLAINGKHAGARRGKGMIAYKTRKNEEAEKIFLELIKDAPDDQGVFWWLGRLAERRGDHRQAIDHYKNAVLHGGEGPLVHLLLARLYLARGLYYRVHEELWRSLAMMRSIFQ